MSRDRDGARDGGGGQRCNGRVPCCAERTSAGARRRHPARQRARPAWLRDALGSCGGGSGGGSCTSGGATYTLLDVAVGDAEAALVSSGQEVELDLDGRSHTFWLGRAARVSVEGHSTCADYVPHDFLEFMLVRK